MNYLIFFLSNFINKFLLTNSPFIECLNLNCHELD